MKLLIKILKAFFKKKPINIDKVIESINKDEYKYKKHRDAIMYHQKNGLK